MRSDRFPSKMTLRKTNKVPLDKFLPENILRIHEYMHEFVPWGVLALEVWFHGRVSNSIQTLPMHPVSIQQLTYQI